MIVMSIVWINVKSFLLMQDSLCSAESRFAFATGNFFCASAISVYRLFKAET